VLKIKRLDIGGFKSFSDRQELRFTGDGIAAVVGPNGCGKSNIGDAISWVLGEQSAKTLRGTRMHDVIFNGSRDRKPSGMASVSLTLVDPEAYLAEKHNGAGSKGQNGHSGAHGKRPGEITVTRKLYRSGESQYLLNGKVCRLRDIQDLFMGTGLGPQHYAIIEQGRIDQILSTRPLDRRTFIEEAAGVTRFKSRKRLAELKLESSRQNLNRVNDILQEVTRQVNSLKRQAARARRYEALRAGLEENLSLVLASQFRVLDRQAQEGGEQLGGIEARCRDLSEDVSRTEAGREDHLRRQRENEQELDARRNELSERRMETERLRSKVTQQAREAEENQRRGREAEAEAARIEERLGQLSHEMQAEQAALEEIGAQAGEIRGKLEEKSREFEERQGALQQAQQRQENLRQQVLRLLGEASALKNQLAKMEEFQAANEREVVRAAAEEKAALEEAEQFGERRREVQAAADEQQQRLDALTNRRAEVEEAIASLREELAGQRQQTQQLQHDLSRMRARGDSIEDLLAHHAYTTETVKKLFAAVERSADPDFRPIGVLADYVEVDPEYEKLTEEFLQEELEYVVVANWQEARQGVELLRREVHGATTFLVHPEHPAPEELPALGPETGVKGRLADHVRLTNGLAASASTLLPRLRGCYLVEEEEAARRLAVQYPGLSFLLPDGLCYRGYTVRGGKKRSAGPLALKRELRELRPAIAGRERELAEVQERITAGEAALAGNEQELESVQADFRDAEREALASDHELRQLADHLRRAERRLSVARADIERLRAEQQETEQRRQETAQAIEEREARRGEAEAELSALQQKMQELEAARTRAADEQTELKTQLAALEERRKAASASLEKIERQLNEQRNRRETIVRQAAEWQTERERLLAENVELEERIEENQRTEEDLEGRIAALSESLEQTRQRTAELEERLKAGRVELEQVREERSRVELRLVEIRSDLKRLEETCTRDLNANLEEVAGRHSGDPPAEELEEARKKVGELRSKIANIGPVNVLALEEYEESQQRQEFLETQRQDLLDSIGNTQKAIAEIDNVSRKKFREAFDAINQHFRQVFQTLFGGGVAEMRLTDEENQDESGVDLIASPPGKRLQNVGLLSGGEKSLTAIALLMATFRYRPSPFCLLDEVDAALDEPNLQRFGRLIRDMSGQVQFIIITHSKTTMEHAQTLYGVTMPEPGVSKLVSVRMPESDTSSLGPAPVRQGALQMRT